MLTTHVKFAFYLSRKVGILIRTYPIISRQLPACNIVSPPHFLLIAMESVSWFRSKASCPKACSPDPFQEVHFYTRPCSHPYFLSYLICHCFTELTFKEFSGVSCFYGQLWLDYKAQAHLWNTCSADDTGFGGHGIFRRWGTADRNSLIQMGFKCYTWPLIPVSSFCFLFHSDMNSLHLTFLPPRSEISHTMWPPSQWLKPSEVRSHNQSSLPQVMWVMYCCHSDTKVAKTETQFYPLL